MAQRRKCDRKEGNWGDWIWRYLSTQPSDLELYALLAHHEVVIKAVPPLILPLMKTLGAALTALDACRVGVSSFDNANLYAQQSAGCDAPLLQFTAR